MSANQHQKPHKMCKSPPKTIPTKTSSTKTLPELGSYEVLNTNCTMVGSNNLNLDSKLNSSISYPNSQIKVCTKSIKSPDSQNLLKKPQSPRAEFLHTTMVQNVNKFTNFNQLRNLQPSPTPNMSNSSTFTSNPTSGFVQQTVRTTKSQQSASFNNGVGMCATMSPSPSAYSNPSPSSYPNNAVSPYSVQISSPANSVSSITSGVVGIKSPVPSPQQNIRPPTPQPILPQAAFQQLPLSGQNLVQIIHAPPHPPPPHSTPTAFPAHSVLTHHRTIIAGASPQQQLSTTTPLVKIKPPQNILPKPPGGTSGNTGSNAGVSGVSGGSVGKTGAGATGVQSVQGPTTATASHLVLPAGQPVPGPALLLNQMPLIVGSGQLQGSGGVQLILRPGTPGGTAPGTAGKLTAATATGAPQVILQPGGAGATAGPHLILQQPGQRGPQQLHQQPQQLVRVLTANGMLSSLNPLGSLNTLTPTYIMQQPTATVQSVPQATLQPSQVQSIQQSQQQQHVQQQATTVTAIKTQTISCLPQTGTGSLQHQVVQQVQANQPGTVQTAVQSTEEQLPPPKKKPKKKKKNKEPKLDLANIMKLSGIGDEDDVLFESDASESAISDPNPNSTQTQKLPKTPDTTQAPQQIDTTTITSEYPKRIGNIHISALNQDTGTSKQATTPNRTDSILTDKQTFGQSQISVQQSLSDINAINQNLTQIGLINQNHTNFLTGNNQILSHINTNQQNSNNLSENQNLASILQALNQGQNLQNFSVLNGPSLQNITSVSQSFPNAQSTLPTSNYQKFSTVLSTNSNLMSNISQNLTNSDTILSGLSKSQSNSNFPQPTQKQATSATNPIVQNITNAHFNIPNAIPNIQVQNFCGNNSNLILNQLNQGNILTPNIPNFSGNITINNSLISNANLTLPSNIVPNFLPANIVQPAQDMNAGFGNNMQRTGGFKLALSEDGRLILQHDPTLNQDIQSQLLLQSIFGINLQGGNLVLTSVNNATSHPQPPKPQTISEPLKKHLQPDLTATKTTNIIQNSIPSVKTEPQLSQQQQITIQPSQNIHPEPTNQNNGNNPPNNYSYIVNLTPDQLETLKRNGQLTVNGQTIFMHRPNVNNKDNNDKSKSPRGKSPKKNQKQSNFENKNAKILQEHLNIKNQNVSDNVTLNQINKVSTSVQSVQTSMTNQTIINSLQSPINKNIQNISNQQIIHITSGATTDPKQTITDSVYQQNTQNIICIQQNSKSVQNHQQTKISDNHLISPKQNIIKQSSNNEQVIILQQKGDNKKETKPESEMTFPNTTTQNLNGIDSSSINVEQFLTNLNINPTNLGQLISQKLSQELPSGVDPKIVNISPGPGHIVAKIDISSDNMQQILNRSGSVENPPGAVVTNSDGGNLVLPPLISMGVKQESQDVFSNGQDTSQSHQTIQQLQPAPSQQLAQSQSLNLQQSQNQLQSQLPALIIGGSVVGNGGEIPTASLSQFTAAPQVVQTPATQVTPQGTQDQGKIYQRVHTIQLTPQKQQLLKSVQLQIQALSARLQQKPADGSVPSDQQEIHTALRHLFLEQQKILATGKVIPNITNINNIATGSMETLTSAPVTSCGSGTTTTKTNNGTFLTSLLQQPVVSHNQNQKVYYHNGNQVIAINPQWSTSASNFPTSVGCITTTTTTTLSPSLPPALTSSVPQPVVTSSPIPIKQNKKPPSSPQNHNNPVINIKSPQSLQQNPLSQGNQQVLMDIQSVKEGSTQTGLGTIPGLQVPNVESQKMGTGSSGSLSPTKRIVKQTYSKAQLIEQQLQTDQNGAINPDITTPFSSKADAVKRLVRYHCYNQPVLSPKDLAKADEIFELTARHFIDKFRFMVNKYQSLLLKESMREVQTSELMMIDRMFLAEEQQSFLKLQSDYKLQNELELHEPSAEATSEAQSSLAPEPTESGFESPQQRFIKTETSDPVSERFEDDNTPNTDLNIKCGLNYFSDESCDSNNFHQEFDEFIGLSTEKTQEKTKNVQNDCYRTKSSMESYNTTKIIGNFEIEINNKSCNSQNYRQKVEKNENFSQKDEDYDEWLCIQRELGYFPENKSENDQKISEASGDHSNMHTSSPDVKSGKIENDLYKKSGHKRTSSESNRLESLKKYRVEKHNSKVKKTGSIIGEVKFEVRIEHKKVFPEQKQMKTESQQNDCLLKQMPMKRTQCFDYSSKNVETSDIYNSKRACLPQKQMPNELTSSFIKQEEDFLEDNSDLNDGRETFDRSIDEQVQSAIDSILNLQQITSMAEKTDGQTDGNKTVLCKKDDLFSGSNPEDTLDEAVNSILS